jgi:hypothetical protein
MRTNTEHIQSLEQGEQMVHRLRNWAVGDTVYGVTSFNLKSEYGAASGKTFTSKEPAEQYFENEPLFGDPEQFDIILFTATIRRVRTDPRNPRDPGEPPLKFAHFEDVEILDRKRPVTTE